MSELSKFKPLGTRVLVKLKAPAPASTSGLIIPEMAQEKPQEGVVAAIGKGKEGDDEKPDLMKLKVGDIVLFSKFTGTEVKLDGDPYLILHKEDIMAIVAPEEAKPK